ncbi:MAG: phytanoyl-CoA dioxygenase family protein [Chloroflexota bacterium]
MANITERLPQPTTDLDTAKADLNIFGYCLLADALAADEVDSVRQRLEEQAAAEREQDLAYRDAGPNQTGVNQRIWFLVNKGQEFRNLLLHKQVRELVGHVLGNEYLLSSYTANIANPGGIIEMHTDQWWMPAPTLDHAVIRPGTMTRMDFRGNHLDKSDIEKPAMIAPAVACNVMWMLTDFTAENGATRVVPGSHLSGRQPDAKLDEGENWVPGVAPAGSAMIFEARTWHSTGANVSDHSRLGVLTYFCAPMFRQQENMVAGTDPAILENAPQELLDLLGFKLWQGYGRIGNPRESHIQPGQIAMGELGPSDIA